MAKFLKCALLVSVAAGFLLTMSAEFTPAAADPVKVRRAVMKELGVHNKAFKKFFKVKKSKKAKKREAKPADMEMRAIAIAAMAKRLPSMFAKGTSLADMPGKTGAKPEIWSRAMEFEAAANNLKALAEKVQAATLTGDKGKIKAAFGVMGKKGCGGCHKVFRKKLKKKKKKTT